jgi:hypothetical protein
MSAFTPNELDQLDRFEEQRQRAADFKHFHPEYEMKPNARSAKPSIGAHLYKHGMAGTAVYSQWRAMKSRCYYAKNKRFANYGGRGIAVCPEWRESFEAFFKSMGEPPPGGTIERIDVNGHYEPGNCCWASRMEQAGNKTNSVFLTRAGETKTVAEWARALGITPTTIYSRVRRGSDPFAGRLA